ncbi:MAG: DMT family transporter [Colwellia sp.]|nr:DMT family transporter [Colwellia sp.]MCW8865059.1 DMT family transporter [Colwellia sp.]MCW9080270.1 DMT family transporter [Colwellia sp.]
MTLRLLVELLLLAAIWGASFIFMRIGSPEFGPILFMALRTLTASLFLLPLVFYTKKHSAFKGYKAKIFVVGIFNTAIPFVLFGYATLTLSGGLTSVLNATTPMFGAIVAYLWFRDKLTVSASFGLLIGFIGVYLLMLDKITLGQQNILLPTLAALSASLCYGISANYTKKYLTGVSSTVLATGSQVSATLVLLPIGLFFIPTQIPSNAAIMSVLLLGILCTGVAYIIFFNLIANLGPSKAMSVTYLIPAFGLFWGSLFLDEVITTSMIIGCGFILTGVALATGLLKLSKRKIDKSKTNIDFK